MAEGSATQIAAEFNENANSIFDLRFAAEPDAHFHDRDAAYAFQQFRDEAPPPPLVPNSHVDLETAVSAELQPEQGSREHEEEEEGQCWVCHLLCEGESGTTETMQLGCNCKEDLSIAHRACAEAWFKIRGNRICEICGATVQNVRGNEDTSFVDQWSDRDSSAQAEPQARCWQSLSLCNFFLASMVATFILLWLFRVTLS